MTGLRRRPGAALTLRHPFRWLTAATLLSIAVQPALLPHPAWVQVVIGGAAGAQGYALAALASVALRRRRPPHRQPSPIGTAALGVVLLLTATLLAHLGQLGVARATSMPEPTLGSDTLAVAGAVLFGTVLIGLGRLIGAGLRALARGLGPRARPVAALLLVPALVLTGSTAATADGGGSGVKGEAFLRGRPAAAAISRVTGRPARTPVRVYIGERAAPTPAARAALAVTALERAGGFDRAAVLINVPTGSGWVNPAAGTALEYLYGGDVATVVTQYAATPSWIAYLRGGEGAQASVRALTDAVHARLARIPARHRPRLLIYGESLGAWGGLHAYDRTGDGVQMSRRTDGALWAGIPGGVPHRVATHALMHPDDPVPAWSLSLMVHDSPDWPVPWLPLVSFWQATGDVIGATLTPPGFGHRYGPELVDAWRPLIRTAGVPSAPGPDRLDAVRSAVRSAVTT